MCLQGMLDPSLDYDYLTHSFLQKAGGRTALRSVCFLDVDDDNTFVIRPQVMTMKMTDPDGP